MSRAISAILMALVGAASASAQLDGSCFVSALNRTARVDADGVWVLPNIPVNAGPVRVRATCVENGVVRSGQSDFLTVPPRGVVAVPEIDFTSPVPIPERLTLEAPVATLTAAGETAQLQALVTYPGGATGDVTQGAAGTDYRSSNPAIASVDEDGLVTARASGVVLVSTLNQGALGVVRLEVVLGGDSDGDGLPDDWELAHGLDPNNPIDALEDPDQDGLSTLAEYQTGLDPFVWFEGGGGGVVGLVSGARGGGGNGGGLSDLGAGAARAVAVGAGTYDAALALPYAYLASAADLRVLDLSDPAHPLYRGRFGAGLFMTETIIEPGGLLFTTQVRPDTPMPIFRLSDPVQPAFISDVVFSDLGLGPGDTTGLAADGSYVYATATRGFEAAYKPGTAGDTRFYVARYLGIDDTAGLPPTVAITSPAPGAAFQETTTVPVAVAASDDVAVARVELLADGEVVSTAAAPPFPLSFQVPLGATTVTLEARAHDFGGNEATSSPVVVDVLPDPPPSVSITAPASGASALQAPAWR